MTKLHPPQVLRVIRLLLIRLERDGHTPVRPRLNWSPPMTKCSPGQTVNASAGGPRKRSDCVPSVGLRHFQPLPSHGARHAARDAIIPRRGPAARRPSAIGVRTATSAASADSSRSLARSDQPSVTSFSRTIWPTSAICLAQFCATDAASTMPIETAGNHATAIMPLFHRLP